MSFPISPRSRLLGQTELKAFLKSTLDEETFFIT